MKKLSLLSLIAVLATSLAIPAVSEARRGGDEDEFEEESNRRRSRARKPVAREVVHGAYIKATFGSLGWFPPLGSESSFGTAAGFEFGYDAVDKLGMTLSITATYYQGINNGISRNDGGSGITQGDFRSIGGLVGVRLGINPGKRKVRRWAIALDVKGGIYVSPKLREPNSAAAGMLQASLGGLILPGIGIEHFSRLSHFSLGVDVHTPLIVGTGLGFAAGIDITPFFKYTF